jgi:hypothetical protein
LGFLNLGFIFLVSITVLLPSRFADIPVVPYLILVPGIILCIWYIAAAGQAVKKITDNEVFGLKDFFCDIAVSAIKPALVILAWVVIVILIAVFVFPFYAGIKTTAAFTLLAFLFWLLFAVCFAFQHFLAIYNRLDRRLFIALKKCFIIFFDNTLFSILTLLFSFVLLVVSLAAALLIPGLAGILLFYDEALRLRLLKYDYLEANPQADRKHIPWDILLIDEKEKTGSRSIKDLIFPWKD